MEWRRLDDSVVTNTDDITIGGPLISGQIANLTLRFSPLRTSHGGQYSCVASITSVAGGAETVILTEPVAVTSMLTTTASLTSV